ncbi:hypothetical protein NDU88_004703 [Pleurodeles waltl]|uniref:Uncharacterized protein n=1 Tax=Pleurodeles waltl TaxID=8319 RepID=A0AAV7MAN7_PLEWA|nr:hypothetical protein NDU88_004703 [Pleurodeles waltl]
MGLVKMEIPLRREGAEVCQWGVPDLSLTQSPWADEVQLARRVEKEWVTEGGSAGADTTLERYSMAVR